MSRCVSKLFVGLVAMMCAVTASAHHSFAAYDQDKTVALKGTVKQFLWNNPHVGIVLTVEEQGSQVDYLIAGGAVASLIQAGWRKTSLKSGDVVTLSFHPMKDGQKGGELLGVVLADGTKLGDGGAQQAGAAQ